MLRLFVLLLSICSWLIPTSTNSAEAWPFGMKPSFSKSARICNEAFEQLASLSVCRPFDARCPEDTAFTSEPPRGSLVATNTYGYTSIYQLRRIPSPDPLEPDLEPIADDVLKSLPNGVALVLVYRFNGDRHPGEFGTWKVNEADLDAALAMPLPDIDPKDYERHRDRNAAVLDAVLAKGERLSEEWSSILAIDGKAYIAERECSGTWVGGNYACNRVIKVTVKRIEANGPSTAYCQVSRHSTSTIESNRRRKP